MYLSSLSSKWENVINKICFHAFNIQCPRHWLHLFKHSSNKQTRMHFVAFHSSKNHRIHFATRIPIWEWYNECLCYDVFLHLVKKVWFVLPGCIKCYVACDFLFSSKVENIRSSSDYHFYEGDTHTCTISFCNIISRCIQVARLWRKPTQQKTFITRISFCQNIVNFLIRLASGQIWPDLKLI